MEKAKTGIAKLDTMLKGGLPRGSTTLLEGPPGAGKSIFAQQFMLTGLKAGESCVYICVDDPPEMIRQRMREFGWDPAKYEESGLLAFVDCFSWRIGGSEERNVMMDMSYDRITDVIREARASLKKTASQRAVIDSMTMLVPQMKMDDALRFLSWLKARSVQFPMKCSIWLAHKTSMTTQQYSVLLDNVGGVIETRFKEEPESLIREVRVTAMPFAAPLPRWIPYTINKGGLQLSV